MAKLERTFSGDFNQILNKIEQGICGGSVTASLEESSDFFQRRCTMQRSCF